MLFLTTACLLAVLSPAASPAAPTHAIQNEKVRVALDGSAHLIELSNRSTDWNYAGGGGVWRVFYRTGDLWEPEAVAPASGPKITADASGITVRYGSLESLKKEKLEISLELRMSLAAGSDDVRWSAVLENRQPGVTVTELQFPLVGKCRLRPGQALIWSYIGGQRFPDPKAEVRRRHSLYMAPDQNGIKMAGMYPGISAATNCFTFAADKEGLYFGSHDPS